MIEFLQNILDWMDLVSSFVPVGICMVLTIAALFGYNTIFSRSMMMSFPKLTPVRVSVVILFLGVVAVVKHWPPTQEELEQENIWLIE